MLFKELKQLLQQLKDEITCPRCNEHYDESEITIVGSLNDETYLHLTCSECGSQAIVNAVINRHNKARKHKGLKVRNLDKPLFEEVTANDVIEMHTFLENFEGDFKNLFSKTK